MSGQRVALSADFRKADGSPTYPSFDLGPLAERGIEIVYVAPEGGRITAASLAGCDALILLVPRFDAESIPGDGRLAVVARFGVGYDSVDVAALTAAGIPLAITPDGVRRPVAVSIVTYVLALSQKLVIKDRITRRGPQGWAERDRHMGTGLLGKTFGQLGLGNIGLEAAKLIAPFGMRLLAHDPFVEPQAVAGLGIELVGQDELFERSDFLSISVPLSEATRHLVGARLLGLMKPTAYLINTARGPIVDQRALHRALVEGRIAGAGLDVFEEEPVPADEPILGLEQVIVTPHALCWTDECFAQNGAADIEAVLAVLDGRPPRHVVNRAVLGDPRCEARLAAAAGRR